MPTIDDILKEAKEAAASDVHLTAGVPPKMRVNGKLLTMKFPPLLPADTLDILLRMTSEEQREQFEEKGEYDMSLSLTGLGRYRVNAYRQRGSVAMAIRVVGSSVPRIEELGLPKSVMKLSECSRGLILSAGIAGSGKTTTLAALIHKMNEERELHIITIEEPIEYLHEHKASMVNQREIGTDTDSYACALKAARRENPDVIMIGEIGDWETLRLVLEAAETGHVVLSGIDAMGTVNALERIMELCPVHQQAQIRQRIANALEAIVSQQLLPAADGVGQAAAYEIMLAGKETTGLIREGKWSQLPGVMKNCHKKGMMTMAESILQLYNKKQITKDTAVCFAQDLERMTAQK